MMRQIHPIDVLANGGGSTVSDSAGTAVVSVLAAALGALLVSVSAYYFARRRVGEAQSTFASELRRSRVGALLCDYIDVGTVQTLARQYNVRGDPDEVSKESSRKRGRRAEVGAGDVKLGGETEDTQTATVVYRLPFDPHSLTERLINSIDALDSIRDDLASIPPIGLAEIEAVAQSGGQLSSARELLEALLTSAKKEQFGRVAEGSEYVLVDSTWRVQSEAPEEVMLSLARLQSGESVANMPAGVQLRITVPLSSRGTDDLTTAQGRQRLRPGATIRASVFGRPSRYEEAQSTLYLAPIAVFSRVGSATSSRRPGR